jgi:hypothetical protein
MTSLFMCDWVRTTGFNSSFLLSLQFPGLNVVLARPTIGPERNSIDSILVVLARTDDQIRTAPGILAVGFRRPFVRGRLSRRTVTPVGEPILKARSTQFLNPHARDLDLRFPCALAEGDNHAARDQGDQREHQHDFDHAEPGRGPRAVSPSASSLHAPSLFRKHAMPAGRGFPLDRHWSSTRIAPIRLCGTLPSSSLATLASASGDWAAPWLQWPPKTRERAMRSLRATAILVR